MTIQKQIWTLDELVLENRIKLGRGDVISKKDIASNPGNFPIYSSAQEKNGVFGFFLHLHKESSTKPKECNHQRRLQYLSRSHRYT